MAEIKDPSSRFSHGPYIVFSDCSTFELAEDASIAMITQNGEDQLEECLDFKGLYGDDVVFISMRDLIAAYNQVHGATL